ERDPSRRPADPGRHRRRGDARPARRAGLLRRDPGGQGHLAGGARARAGRPRRSQRGRQDDDAAHDLRPVPSPHRHDRLRRGRPDPARAAPDRRPGHRPGAGGAPDLRRPDGAREPDARRHSPQGPGRPRWRSGARLRPLPGPPRADRPEGGHDVRRRAADAGNRPGADGEAEPAAPGRAVARPGTADGRPHLRGHRPPQGGGGDDAAGRAERPQGAGGGRPRLRDGDRDHHDERRRRGVGRQPGDRKGLPWPRRGM
ncbi:MAG: Branched-chain amino acid transport ATP-binding protein LivF, partial [uncultured Thermomicrobiales bacterium]